MTIETLITQKNKCEKQIDCDYEVDDDIEETPQEKLAKTKDKLKSIKTSKYDKLLLEIMANVETELKRLDSVVSHCESTYRNPKFRFCDEDREDMTKVMDDCRKFIRYRSSVYDATKILSEHKAKNTKKKKKSKKNH